MFDADLHNPQPVRCFFWHSQPLYEIALYSRRCLAIIVLMIDVSLLRRDELEYSGPPVSDFQKMVRGDETVLVHHISKTMNDLNLERCKCIPKNVTGADWRVLEEIVRNDPSREKFQVSKQGILRCSSCSAALLVSRHSRRDHSRNKSVAQRLDDLIRIPWWC